MINTLDLQYENIQVTETTKYFRRNPIFSCERGDSLTKIVRSHIRKYTQTNSSFSMPVFEPGTTHFLNCGTVDIHFFAYITRDIPLLVVFLIPLVICHNGAPNMPRSVGWSQDCGSLIPLLGISQVPLEISRWCRNYFQSKYNLCKICMHIGPAVSELQAHRHTNRHTGRQTDSQTDNQIFLLVG